MAVCVFTANGIPYVVDVPAIYNIHIIIRVSSVAGVRTVDGAVAVAFIPCIFSRS